MCGRLPGRKTWWAGVCVGLGVWLAAVAGLAQDSGEIFGVVRSAGTGQPLEKVNVSIKGTTFGAATDTVGRFFIRHVPPGKHTLKFSAIGFINQELSDVEVKPAQTTRVDVFLLQEVIALEDVFVYGASKYPVRLLHAPAAVSTLSDQQIKELAPTGQVPRLFDGLVGVDVVQNDINDFNINSRGFNSSLNRRMLVLLDNRETSGTFLGAQEWNALSIPVGDIDRIELIRGPGSALYGANAFSGVITMTTPAPKNVLGTRVSLVGGELNTIRGDLRHAGQRDRWSYKFNFGAIRYGTWSKSRNIPQDELDRREYPGLSPELVPLDDADLTAAYGSGRVDYDLFHGRTLVFEGGITEAQDQVFITGLGRVQVDDVIRPWLRANYTSERFFSQVDYNGRKTLNGQQLALNSATTFKENSYDINLQFHHQIVSQSGRAHLIWGASQRFQHVDTGLTLTPRTYDENQTGVFAQLEMSVSDKLDVIAAGRYDRSTLHPSQFSPKVALVYSLDPAHSIRLTFNRAFQTPNYSEFFLRAPAGLPVDLAPLEERLETELALERGVPRDSVDLPLNFGLTPMLALGNRDLDVEKIWGYELGYRGVHGDKLFLSANIYFNRLSDFITDLLPRVNPAFPAYQVPGQIDPALRPRIISALQETLGPNFPLLSTLPDGSLAMVVSYANAGRVNEWGLELDLSYYLTDQIMVNGNYTYFDYDVNDQATGDVLLPNTPRHKFNLGVSYAGANGIDASVRVRFVDSFDWAAGIFQGRVPSYALVNLAGGYRVKPDFRVGLVVNNLFDNKHYELFGGSVNGRRAVATATVDF